MEKQTKILIGVGLVGLVGYALWRNFGVKPKGSVILNSAWGNSTDSSNTKEQKELIAKIQEAHKDFSRVKDGDTLTTSFGKYKFIMTKAPTEEGHWYDEKGYWTKYAEVWQGFADDKNNIICPQGYKYVRYPIIKGFKEHLSNKGKCVENDVNVTIEDSSIHSAPKFNASGRGNVPCVYLSGNELINGLTSTYDSNICVSSSGKGQVYSEHNTQWKSKI